MNRQHLKGKFTPPRFANNYTPRPRLLKIMEDKALTSPNITLVTAPAGYGKTSLLADCAASVQNSLIWISLDKYDNEALRFVENISCGFSLLHGPDKEYLRALTADLNKANAPTEANEAGHCLAEEIESFGAPLTVVLDDFHLIRAPYVREMFQSFLNSLPSNLNLLIGSREDPPFKLSRHRSAGRVHEIRADQLSFTHDETRDFVKKAAQYPIAPEDFELVYKKTEGWPAALSLITLALTELPENRSKEILNEFGCLNVYIIDYLLEEILAEINDEIRNFLVETSILNRKSAELCEFATGNRNSGKLFSEVCRLHLLVVPLDTKKRWIRYHQLLTDYLKTQLPKTRKTEICLKAANWYRGQGDEVIAQSYLLQMGSEEPQVKQPELPKSVLGRRENEIFLLMKEGLGNSEIAERLFISIGTVKWHINRIYTKLNVRNRIEAVNKTIPKP